MIEKMKFISITGPKADIDRVVSKYLSKYEIHLENALSELTSVQNLTPYIEINPYKESLQTITGFYEELEPGSQSSVPEIPLEKALEFTANLKEEMSQKSLKQKNLEDLQNSLTESLKIIQPFHSMDFPLSSLLHFQFVSCHFGRIEKTYYEKLKKYIYDDLDTVFCKCDDDGQYVWGIYFSPRSQMDKIDAVYASTHFEQMEIPDNYPGTVKEAYEALTRKLKDIQTDLEEIRAGRTRRLEELREEILGSKEALELLSASFDVRRLAACTDNRRDTFYILCGWMSDRDTQKFQKEIMDDDQIFCIVEDYSVYKEKQPPTKLRNPRIIRPFEMYVKMYGLPSYGEFDPTWFVALTYSLIFGTMFGDVGQGLCLVVGGALLYRFRKMTLAAIISMAGIFSTIFGFLYGSFFGFEELLPAIWLKPKEAMTSLPFIGQMNTVFVVAIAFGMFLILVTIVFHIINAIHSKDLENILFDQNAIAGLVFYGSLVAVIVLYMTGKKLPAAGVLVVMFLIPLLLIMLKEPLTRLVQKKQPAIEGSKPMFFVQSFFELFEVLLSYFSNTLSFVRMGAFAVSHAAMMEVVLMLAGAANGDSVNWLVIILGNIFVCAMEGLIVGIQVLRLEYYEMFSRFYKGDGREFKPFLRKKA